MIGEIACQMLTFLGYEARHVLDGEEAISLYRQHLEAGDPFAAVIMDLTIPKGMGGKEAVLELLALDPQARVLVSSGYSNDPGMVNFSRYGFCGHIENRSIWRPSRQPSRLSSDLPPAIGRRFPHQSRLLPLPATTLNLPRGGCFRREHGWQFGKSLVW